jgi:hypothetical protein
VRLTDLGITFLKEARDAYLRVEAAYETGRQFAHRRDLGFTVAATEIELLDMVLCRR